MNPIDKAIETDIDAAIEQKKDRLIERMADFDCFQPWGVPCDKCIGGEEPCEACTAKEIARMKEVA